jgi:hypothetical protein
LDTPSRRLVPRLFIGGVWHGKTAEIPEDAWNWRVAAPVVIFDVPADQPLVQAYIRRRMYHPTQHLLRSVFAIEAYSDYQAVQALREHLFQMWIEGAPE